MHESPRIPPGVSALLFDLGGVIVDIDWRRVFTRWAAHSRLPATEIAQRFRMDAPYEEHERGTLVAADYFAHLRAMIEFEGTDEALVQGWNDIFVGEIADTVRLVAALRAHVRCYLFSNSNPTHEAEWRTRFAGAIDLFGGVFVSSSIGHRKPERAAFAAIAEATDVPLHEFLFFDDTPENVEGARAAGLRAAHVLSPADIVAALRG